MSLPFLQSDFLVLYYNIVDVTSMGALLNNRPVSSMCNTILYTVVRNTLGRFTLAVCLSKHFLIAVLYLSDSIYSVDTFQILHGSVIQVPD